MEIRRSSQQPAAKAVGKKVPLNVKVSPAVRDAIDRAAEADRRPPGNLAAALLEWSAARLTDAGSLGALLRTGTVARIPRVSEETQDQLYTGLRIILERAPSEIVRQLSREIGRLADRFGEPGPLREKAK